MKRACAAAALMCPLCLPAQTLSLRGQLDAAASLVHLPAGTSRMLSSDVGGASFLALEARETLQAGWTALAVLDGGLQVDTGLGRVNNDVGSPTFGSSAFSFNRRAVVGLRMPAGDLLLGRDYHALLYACFATDPFGMRFWGNLAGFTQLQSGRFNNGLYFSSTPVRGWRMRASLGLGDDAPGAAARGAGRSLALDYGQAGLSLNLAVLREHTGAGHAFALPDNDAAINTRLLGVALDREGWHAALGASWLQGQGRASGHRRRAQWLGGAAPLAPDLKLHALLARTDSHPGRAWTVSMALEKSLSSRTALYANCARVFNDALSNVALAAAIPQVGAAGPNAAAGALRGYDPAACSLGGRHSF